MLVVKENNRVAASATYIYDFVIFLMQIITEKNYWSVEAFKIQLSLFYCKFQQEFKNINLFFKVPVDNLNKINSNLNKSYNLGFFPGLADTLYNHKLTTVLQVK